MRLGLLSDIHGNLQALRTVLDRLDVEGVDRIVCLGDVVGYGGDPEACLALVRERASTCILGNHDAAVVDARVRRTFNTAARRAVEAHAAWLDASAIAWLAGLPLTEQIARAPGQDLFLTHGTPGETYLFTYLTNARQAGQAFRSFDERFAAVGHTHVPALFETDDNEPAGARTRDLEAKELASSREAVRDLAVTPGRRAILNPGGVGQPRDGDPRAACAILDLATGAIRTLRLAYDVGAAQAAILRRGLPEVLAARLAFGY